MYPLTGLSTWSLYCSWIDQYPAVPVFSRSLPFTAAFPYYLPFTAQLAPGPLGCFQGKSLALFLGLFTSFWAFLRHKSKFHARAKEKWILCCLGVTGVLTSKDCVAALPNNELVGQVPWITYVEVGIARGNPQGQTQKDAASTPRTRRYLSWTNGGKRKSCFSAGLRMP